jgi:hypothetical protein
MSDPFPLHDLLSWLCPTGHCSRVSQDSLEPWLFFAFKSPEYLSLNRPSLKMCLAIAFWDKANNKMPFFPEASLSPWSSHGLTKACTRKAFRNCGIILRLQFLVCHQGHLTYLMTVSFTSLSWPKEPGMELRTVSAFFFCYTFQLSCHFFLSFSLKCSLSNVTWLFSFMELKWRVILIHPLSEPPKDIYLMSVWKCNGFWGQMFLVLLAYINYTRGFHCDISRHICNVFWFYSSPLLLIYSPLTSSPPTFKK